MTLKRSATDTPIRRHRQGPPTQQNRPRANGELLSNPPSLRTGGGDEEPDPDCAQSGIGTLELVRKHRTPLPILRSRAQGDSLLASRGCGGEAPCDTRPPCTRGSVAMNAETLFLDAMNRVIADTRM